MSKIPIGNHPDNAEQVVLVDIHGNRLALVDGKVPVEMTVNIEGAVDDAKIKGSPDGGTTFVPVKVKEDGTLLAEVQLSGSIPGSIPTLWGATIDDRPDAHSVEVGQIFVLANETLDMWVSSGISWVVIS